MGGYPTYRIFDEFSSYRFSVLNELTWRFFENLLFQIDMICFDVRNFCTSLQNSEMQRNDWQDFREASASDPLQPELAPLKTYLRLSIFKNPQRVAVVTEIRKLSDLTPFLRFFALGLFNWARGRVLHGRYADPRCLERGGVEKCFTPASNMLLITVRQLDAMTWYDVPNGGRHNNKTIESLSSRWNIFTFR